MKTYEVVAAIIVHSGKILCTQRKPHKYDYISNKWEFPGGKVEVGETNEEALRREILEELNLIINIKNEFITVDHKYEDFGLIMHSFICHVELIDIKLHEHISYKWLKRDELQSLDWAAADIPIVNKLSENSYEYL